MNTWRNVGRVAQSVLRLTKGWTARGSNSGGERDFPPSRPALCPHPASCTVGTGSFPGVKFGRGLLLTTHPLLVPWSWKGTAIALPTFWATTGPVTGKLYLFLLEEVATSKYEGRLISKAHSEIFCRRSKVVMRAQCVLVATTILHSSAEVSFLSLHRF